MTKYTVIVLDKREDKATTVRLEAENVREAKADAVWALATELADANSNEDDDIESLCQEYADDLRALLVLKGYCELVK